MNKRDDEIIGTIVSQIKKYSLFNENTTLRNVIDFTHINIMLHAIMKRLMETYIIEDYKLQLYRNSNIIGISWRAANMISFTGTKLNIRDGTHFGFESIYERLE